MIENSESQENCQNESISAYVDILSEYSLIDENFDTNEIFKILSKKLFNLNESDLQLYVNDFYKIFTSLDRHPRIGKLLLKHFTVNFFQLFINSFFFFLEKSKFIL